MSIVFSKALHMIRASAASAIIFFAVALLAMCFIQEHDNNLKETLKAVKKQIRRDGRLAVWRIMWLAWTTILLHVTIIGRSINYDPLSQVLTGWKITKDFGIWNFDALYNVLMFIPYTLFLYIGWPRIFAKDDHWLIIIGKSIKISFLSSLFIETTQLIFSCGTFQISDLTYNTISGLIGGLVYTIIRNRSQ